MALVVQTGLIGMMVFAPLAFGAVEVWSRSVLEAAAFALAGLWLIRIGFGRPAPPALPRPLWVMMALAAAGLSLPWIASLTLYPRGTLEALVAGAAYAAIFALVVSTVRTEREIRRMVLALIVTGFGVALFAILQKYAGNGKIFGLRAVREGGSAFGPFVNRNHFAGYMGMLIPLSIGYTVAAFSNAPARGGTAGRRFVHRLTSEGANRLALLVFMTLIMSVSLVLSFSRAGIVSFLTAVLLIGLILVSGRASKRWVLLPGLLVAALLISLAWFGLGPLIDRYQTLLHLPEDRSMRGRIVVWTDSLRIAADHPVMGTGLGTFGAVYPAYKTLPDPVFYEHAHNDYVELLAETGGVGLGLSLGLLGTVLGFVLAGWRGRRSPSARGLLAGVVTGIAALLIHGFNDFNFHIPANAALFAVLLGLAWNLARPAPSETLPVRPRRLTAAAGLAAVGILLVQTATTFAADRYYRIGLERETAGRTDAAAADFRRAIDWDAGHPRYHLALGRLYERLYRAGDPAALSTARSEMDRTAALVPTLAEPHLHLGWIRARSGDDAGADGEFERVLALDPTNPVYLHYVGLWFAATGRTERAAGLARRLRDAGQAARAAEIEERMKKT